MSRRPLDFYPTSSEWMVRQLLQHAMIEGSVLEPCSGNNDIARVLSTERGVSQVITNDIDRQRPAMHNFNAGGRDLYKLGDYDWIVTNPPFNDAMRILEMAHKHAKKGVAFLLRLSFLEPTLDRGPWLAENPPTQLIVLPRYSFTGDGKTDSVTTCWCVWEKDAESTYITVVPREPKRKTK